MALLIRFKSQGVPSMVEIKREDYHVHVYNRLSTFMYTASHSISVSSLAVI